MIKLIVTMKVGVLFGVLSAFFPTEADAATKYQAGRCQVQQRDLPESLYPITVASSYIYDYQRNSHAFKSFDLEAFSREAKASLVSQPKFGQIEMSAGRLGNDWHYVATKFNKDGTYVGRDHFIVKVSHKGVTVSIHYYIEVIGEDPPTYNEDSQTKAHFCQKESWKISGASEALTTDESDPIRSAGTSALISVASSPASGWQSSRDAA